MKNKIHFDIEKKVHWSLSKIKSLTSEKAFKIINNPFTINNALTTISKKDDEEFICKIFLDKIHDHTYNQNVEKFGILEEMLLDSTGYEYLIEKKSATSLSLTLSEPQVLTLSLSKFQSGLKQDYENKTHRLVIPISSDPTFNLIEAQSLKIGDTTSFFAIITINLNKKTFHLFKYKNDDTKKSYLFIDALQESSFAEFKNDTNAIITGFGYITGDLFLDEYYYQTINKEDPLLIDHIAYQKYEKTVITKKPILDPSGFRQYLDKFDEKKDKNIPHWISSDVFSNLCSAIKSNETFSRCCKLIVEGNNNEHVLLSASIFSIALETLTNIIYEENKEKINPIEEKKLAKIIREKLKETIGEYDEFISEYGLNILNAKINDINKPTNSKKLSMPFELYGLKLSKEDVEILNHRNKFLHGTSPFDESELKEKKDELLFISARLQFMLNSLMLKYVGYSGHIINYPSWIQLNKKEKVTDHLYKII